MRPTPRDLMLDLETLSTRPNAAIMSIGAVVFDPYAEEVYSVNNDQIIIDEGRLFYTNVSLEGQIEEFHRHIDASTLTWWMSQDADARRALGYRQLAFPAALHEYAAFCHRWRIERVWGYGATADNVWIDDALRTVGTVNPVSYRGQRCMRTVAALFPVDQAPFVGVQHNALHDAINQVVYLQHIFRTFPRGLQEQADEPAAA